MQIIKIEIGVKDMKYSNYQYTELAINEDAAIKFLDKQFPGLKERKVTESFDSYTPLREFEHVKNRYDEDGEWEYPVETTIQLYLAEVLE